MIDDDGTQAQLQEAVARLSGLSSAEDFWVGSTRKWHGLKVREGLAMEGCWAEVFEPVRERWLLTSTWQPLQSVSSAEDGCLEFLRRRPDLQ